MKFLTYCDLNKNELRNAVLQPLATAPESPRVGQIYFDTTDNSIKQYNGTAWTKAGVVYEQETDTNGVITGLAGDGTVTVTAIDDMTLEDGTTLGTKIEDIADAADTNVTALTATAEQTDDAVLATITEKKKNDIATISRQIYKNDDKNVDLNSVTAYVYDGEKWVAADGNYSAKNVYFPNKTVPCAGKSVYDTLMDAFSDKKNPSKTNPSVKNFAVTGNDATTTTFEVGTTVTPQWKCDFNSGAYTYKSSVSNTTITPVSGTGVTATGWEVKQGDTVIGAVEDGKASSSFVIGDGTTAVSGTVTYSITADYSNGNYALTNLDTLPDSEVRITAGTTTAVTDTLTYVRKMFGGGTSAATLTSADVRGEKSATASVVGSSAPFEFSAVAGDAKIFFAYPKALTTKTPKFEIFTMAWGETSGFTTSEVSVADASGNNAITYTVYTYAPAGGFVAAETKYRVYF